jgi:hypothetical protein
MKKYAIIVREFGSDSVIDCSIFDPNTFLEYPTDRIVFVYSELEFYEFTEAYQIRSTGKVNFVKLSHSFDSEPIFTHH